MINEKLEFVRRYQKNVFLKSVRMFNLAIPLSDKMLDQTQIEIKSDNLVG